MLEAKCLKKAVVPSTLIENPSPGSIQPTRLALHVSQDQRSCFVYIASGPRIYKLQIAIGESSVTKGKDSLLIPWHTEIIDPSLVNRCPHRSEIQSIVLVEAASHGYLMLGSVDSYGHLIVSKLDASGKDDEIVQNPPQDPPQNPPPPPPRLMESSNLMNSNALPSLHPSYRLNGKNYFNWAQFMRTNLKGCGKLNHIEGTPLPSTDLGFPTWDNEDSLIMSWMWNNMIPEISGNFMFLATAREIWDSLSQTYSKKKDLSARFGLKSKTFNTKQGNMSVSDYFAIMKGLWIELDQYQTLKMETSNDMLTLNTCIQTDRIFEFFAGLNSEYDLIRLQILGKDCLPSLDEVFYIVRDEESCRGFMLGTKPSKGFALATSKIGRQGSSKPGREDRYCEHCKKPGHTKDRCFRLYGKDNVLTRIGGFKGTQAHVVASTPTPSASPSGPIAPSPLGAEDLDRLQNLLDSLRKPSGSSSLTMTGSYHGEDDWSC